MTAGDRIYMGERGPEFTRPYIAETTPPVATTANANFVSDREQYMYGCLTLETAFYRYDRVAKTWAVMAPLPAAPAAAWALAYADTHIYATQGNSSTAFWKYTIATNTWDVMAVLPQSGALVGNCLVYDGAGHIYHKVGVEALTFHRYTISGNTWAAVASLAAGAGLQAGSSLLAIGQERLLLCSSGAANVHMFSPYLNAWATFATVPAMASFPARAFYLGGRYVYAAAHNNVNMYRIDIIDFTSQVMPGQAGTNLAAPTNQYVSFKDGFVYYIPNGWPSIYRNDGLFRFKDGSEKWIK